MKEVSAHLAEESPKKVCAPNNSHHLTPDDGISPISPDTKVELHRHALVSILVMNDHAPFVKVHRLHFVSEENADVRQGRGFVQEPLI